MLVCVIVCAGDKAGDKAGYKKLCIFIFLMAANICCQEGESHTD